MRRDCTKNIRKIKGKGQMKTSPGIPIINSIITVHRTRIRVLWFFVVVCVCVCVLSAVRLSSSHTCSSQRVTTAPIAVCLPP
ncbi:uncharacterized protein BO72DRAFT_21807 [Aspergillus fijiensis CBS 313.89]|uniref:Uncharacterized protein n=1 Tax=Aspergillus fijiensis CBS 313.89 TaxID=1448319 RepID=A0A8G1W1V8_9EURO|nr:uncharacterized protein BO72DRAFT_21807 [Aspergillus fijiensis CBS 313.89]RAK79816.1 hypothetical protein BO72DRAFT_21807 [Aspergillus fijiensis CBS 313.89]